MDTPQAPVPPQGAASNQPAATPAVPTVITYDDFAKVELRVGTVVEAVAMEKSKKLLKLQVDLGNGQRRQVLAGIKEHYTPEQMLNRQIILVANLAPRAMMGETSHGMLLAATDAVTGKVIVMGPYEPVAPGSGVK
jgi:methionyl-tRNA synthetase